MKSVARRILPSIAAGALAVMTLLPAHATTATQIKKYLGGDDSVLLTGSSPVSRCATSLGTLFPYGTAGQCFDAPEPYSTTTGWTVDISIDDAVSPEVAGLYWVSAPYCGTQTCGWQPGPRIPFCSGVPSVPVPPAVFDDQYDASYMWFAPRVNVVVMGPAYTAEYCGEPGAGTTGTITLAWHS